MDPAIDTSDWGDPVIEGAARRILDAGLGTGRSAIDGTESVWSESVAADLHHRIIEKSDFGPGTFIGKLKAQLSGASRDTHLLCAELLYLHVVPLTNVGAANKRRRIGQVLSWAEPPAELPADFDEALGGPGVFNGGIGFNVQVWNQIGWLLSFVQHWWQCSEAERTAALSDPWSFRDVVATTGTDQPSIRNSLLYLAFPKVFFPIVSQEHKQAIRDTFAPLIGGATGKDPIAIDKDLLEIRARQMEEVKGASVNYYVEPYLSQWAKHRDKGQRAWLIRRPAGEDLATRWRMGGLVSLPAEHLPELEPGTSRPEIRSRVEEAYGHVDYVQRLALAREFDVFFNRMKVEDIVVTVDGDHLYVGQITGEPVRSDTDGGEVSRAAAWSATDSALVSTAPARLRADLGQPGAVVDLTGEIDALIPLVQLDVPDVAEPDVVSVLVDEQRGRPTLRDATAGLATDICMDEQWLQRIIELLQDRQQIVLYGPPGTGKTYLARALAGHLADGDAVRLVQFHPSYSYEDFLEGYRPDETDSGAAAFRLRPGPMRQLAAEATKNPGRPYILIIDEINRGNLAKIFGELYFLLEYREESIQLQYSPNEPFTLPANVFFIATMNTADRSIALIDSAMRRRFAFVEMHPSTSPVRDVLERWLRGHGKEGDGRARLLAALNAEIGVEDRDFQIGPSYLMTRENERPGGLDRVWEYSILPLLEEHYYGRLSRAEVHTRFGLAAIQARADRTLPES